MSKFTYNLAVQIVRFVDASNPGVVACEFLDANDIRHTIIDKVPVVSLLDLDASSKYPQPGAVRCEVLMRWHDAGGRERARITTEIESTEESFEFVVLSSQLSIESNQGD
ncbi:MAG TPA: hypothetical protein VJA94_02885 [Candidatus Angelobacter sp.]